MNCISTAAASADGNKKLQLRKKGWEWIIKIKIIEIIFAQKRKPKMNMNQMQNLTKFVFEERKIANVQLNSSGFLMTRKEIFEKNKFFLIEYLIFLSPVVFHIRVYSSWKSEKSVHDMSTSSSAALLFSH